MKPETQAARLLAYLRANPGVSSLDITLALRIVNVTGRVSDLRAAGHNVVCAKGKDGVDRYHLHVEAEQLTLGAA